MKHLPKITCDECPAERAQANHWIQYKEHPGGRNRLPAISFGTWDQKTVDRQRVGDLGHVCGLECASKRLMKFLSSQRELNKPAVPAE